MTARANTSGGATRLQDLTDVDPSVVTDGKPVVYDSASGKFKGEALPLPTKRVTLPISADVTGSQAGFTDMAQRFLINLSVATTRWRLKIRNTGNSGAITLSDVYLGTPSFNSDGWSGANTGTGTAVLTGLSLPSDGSEYTTGWVSNAGQQFAARTPGTITLGNTQGSGVSLLKSSNYTSVVFTGAGAAASVANANLTGGINYNAQFFDIRFEYEFQGNNPVVLCIGDSITSGLFDALTPNVVAPHALWPGLAGHRNNFAWITLGAQGNLVGPFTSPSGPYTRLDLATTVPDAAIIKLGINDANSLESLATYQSQMAQAITTLRGFGIKRIYVATLIPQPRWKPGRLLSAAASGATSLSTDIVYAAGDVITIDYGLGASEARTVDSGGSTGSYAPYATPITVATSNNHGLGAHIGTASELLRRSYNQWLGSGVPNTNGTFDFARACSSADNMYGGAPELYSTASIHPGDRAHQAMAECVTLASLPGVG